MNDLHDGKLGSANMSKITPTIEVNFRGKAVHSNIKRNRTKSHENVLKIFQSLRLH